MSTPPNSSTANAESLAALTALQDAANAEFIDQATLAIANATAQGIYHVVMTTFEYCDIQALQIYFRGLGYMVIYPDLLNPNLNPFNPAELFGQAYIDYWNNGGIYPGLTNPCRIRLEWQVP